jgi:hypothetical protein
MARNNKITATFIMEAGDGASGFTETYETTAFLSGDCVKIDGTCTNAPSAFTISDYGMAQADGIYLENRSADHELTFSMTNGQTIINLMNIAPKGIFMVRLDPDMQALLEVVLIGNAAGNEFVLILTE